MKNSVFFSALLGLALVVAVSGCKHNPASTVHIPGAQPKASEAAPIVVNPGPVVPSVPVNPAPTIPPTVEPQVVQNPEMKETAATTTVFETGTPDPKFFEHDIVYFDTDSNVIKKSEQSKIEDIAKYLKENSADVVLVEGHCDERGTEGYNQSLGERRALAIREYLINLGIDGARIRTVSFGLSKPVDPGHNEAAWKKNRRGVSVLYRAKAKA